MSDDPVDINAERLARAARDQIYDPAADRVKPFVCTACGYRGRTRTLLDMHWNQSRGCVSFLANPIGTYGAPEVGMHCGRCHKAGRCPEHRSCPAC